MNKLSSCAIQVSIINDLGITDFEAFKIVPDSTGILPHSSMPFASVNVNAILRSVSDAGRSEYWIFSTLGDHDLDNRQDVSAHRDDARVE